MASPRLGPETGSRLSTRLADASLEHMETSILGKKKKKKEKKKDVPEAERGAE